MRKTTEKFDATIFGITSIVNGVILCVLAYFSNININKQYGVLILTTYIAMYLTITVGMSFLLIYFFNSKKFISIYEHSIIEKVIYVCLLFTCVCNGIIFYFCEFKKIINSTVGLNVLLWLPANLFLGYLGYIFYNYKPLSKVASAITIKKPLPIIKPIVLIETKEKKV